jgi:hypothetical protein
VIEIKRLRSWADDAIRSRKVEQEIDARICDECGRGWSEVDEPGGYAPDGRGYVQIRGRIGVSVIRTVLCPRCADDLVSEIEEHLDQWEGIRYRRLQIEEKAEVEALSRRESTKRSAGLRIFKETV